MITAAGATAPQLVATSAAAVAALASAAVAWLTFRGSRRTELWADFRRDEAGGWYVEVTNHGASAARWASISITLAPDGFDTWLFDVGGTGIADIGSIGAGRSVSVIGRDPGHAPQWMRVSLDWMNVSGKRSREEITLSRPD